MEEKTIGQLLDEQIRKTYEDLDIAQFTDGSQKPLLDKLRLLQQQKNDLVKLENDIAAKNRELDISAQKLAVDADLRSRELELSVEKQNHEFELNTKKLESETAIKIREQEHREEVDKLTHELEEAKQKEQKRANTAQAIVGGVTAATGVAGLIATVSCFNKSLRFEETGSFTNKSGQVVGSLFNLFRKRG